MRERAALLGYLFLERYPSAFKSCRPSWRRTYLTFVYVLQEAGSKLEPTLQ